MKEKTNLEDLNFEEEQDYINWCAYVDACEEEAQHQFDYEHR